MSKFVALVPMKAHSMRVKDKNIREVGGVPLFFHILKTLGECRTISNIYVDTDSSYIKERIYKDFKNVQIIDRLPHLAGSSVPMNDVITYDLSLIKGKYFLQTHATNPLLKSETIDNAIKFFLSQQTHDSLFSVTRILKRFYDVKGRPINHDPQILLNTQDLTPVYEENSCIYIFTRESFGKNKNRVGSTPCMYEIDKKEAIDIDDEFDFEMVKFIFNFLKNQKKMI